MPTPLSDSPSTWSPLLDGDLAARARAAVAGVAAALRDPEQVAADPGFTHPGIAGGTPGAALFFAELHAVSGEQADADTALAFLDRALEDASEARPSVPLYVGTVGVGWTLAYLERHLLDPDDEPNDVDEFVAEVLASGRWREFDLIRGVTGIGVYLLERGLPLDPLVTALTDLSVELPDGRTWWVDPASVPRERAEMFPEGYYDVGLAHGQAGVVALLAAAYAAGTASARPLLEESTAWLRAQRLPEGTGPGRFPLIFGPGTPPSGGRLAWCYGDIGVAVALLAAGRALGDKTLVDEAHELALESAARPLDHCGVMDQSICHGSAGLALLFARLAHELGDERLADAARTWAGVLLDQLAPGEPVAGVRFSAAPEPGSDERVLEPRAGLLEGAAGVGLTLLALTGDRAPDWDLVFLTRPVR